MKKYSVVLSSRECYAKTKLPGNVILKWTIHNQSKKQWDEQCVLKNHCSDDVYVRPLTTKTRLQPNEVKDLVMNLYLPADFKSEKVVLLFQFENAEGDRFGDSMIGIIDIDLPMEEDIFGGPAMRKSSIKQSQFIDDDILYLVAS